MAVTKATTKPEPRWWAAVGGVDNHTYKVDAKGVQRCHMCGEVEPPLAKPGKDERTNRAAMHMVHGVKAHLNTTVKEWNAA
jgi:hypothetical protein